MNIISYCLSCFYQEQKIYCDNKEIEKKNTAHEVNPIDHLNEEKVESTPHPKDWKIIDSYESVFEGEFDDLLNGKGRKTNEEGSIEEGEFKNGKLHGKGKIYWLKLNDLRIKEGEFKEGFLTGQGIRIEFDGTKIEGNFKEDLLDGKGSIDLIGGGGYYGNFKEGVLHGEGKIKGRTGTMEEGEYIDGILQDDH